MADSRAATFEVIWHRPTDSQVAARGLGAAVQVIMELPELFDFDLSVEAGAEEPLAAAFIVGGVDAQHAHAIATEIRSVLNGYVPWMGLGEVKPHVPKAGPPPSRIYDLVEVSGPGRPVLHEFAPCWSVAAAQPTRTTMNVRVSRMNLDGVEEPSLACEVSVSGDGGGVATVAATLAGELAGSTRYATRPRRYRALGVSLDLPIDVAGRLLSTPARIRNGWPVHPVIPSQDIMTIFADSVPPHSAVFGGSGLGKTTFLEHRIKDHVDRGDQVVVLCPHGDLPRRAAQILDAAGVPFDAVDFGHAESPPRWSVLSPPTGVPAAEWLDVLPEIVLARWREKHDLNGAMAGPMWHFAFMAAATLLGLDPTGPKAITAVGDLLTGDFDQRWVRAAAQAGTEDALDRLRQVRAAIANDKEQSYQPWLMSKLSVFTSNSRVRRIVDNSESSFDVARAFSGRSLLVSAPQSALGDDGSSVVLTGVLHQIWNVARRRPTGHRRNILLVIDEAQLLDPKVTGALLREGRKFGLELVVASQSPSSLERDLREAVLVNTGAIGTFRVGPADAGLLDMKFPTVSVGTIERLPRFTMAVTNAERDFVALTAEPLADADDPTAFDRAHRRTMGSPSEQRVVDGVPEPSTEPGTTNRVDEPAPVPDPFNELLDRWSRS